MISEAGRVRRAAAEGWPGGLPSHADGAGDGINNNNNNNNNNNDSNCSNNSNNAMIITSTLTVRNYYYS